MEKEKISAGIVGAGSALPSRRVTNADLAKFVDTSDEWIRTRTGITERCIADENTSTGDLAYLASQKALKNAKLKPEALDLIIVATTTPDMLFPSTACIVQARLGINNIPAFDISAACSGFVYALSVANQYIKSNTYQRILVVGADTLTKYVNWEDRATCVLFGDGAGAVVLQANRTDSGILSSLLGAEGEEGKYLSLPGGGSRKPLTPKLVEEKEHCIKMDGKEVFKFAVRTFEKSVIKALEMCSLSIHDISLLVPHQANVRIIDHALKKLGLSKEKVFVNVQKYGNTSAASIPIGLDEALKEGRIKPGDIVVIAAFGAGLTYGACVIRW